MPPEAPLQWIINQITSIIGTSTNSVAETLSSTIAPLFSACFGIYIILIMVNYLRGAESEPVFDFFLRMASWAVVIFLAFSAGAYTTYVVPIITGLGDDLATAVTGAPLNAASLDKLLMFYTDIFQTGLDNASILPSPLNLGDLLFVYFKFFIVCLGLMPLVIAATIILIVAKVGLLLVASVGPLFIGLALFPATRQYFSAWINTAFSYALIPLFVAIIAQSSIQISTSIFDNGTNLDLSKATMLTCIGAALCNIVLLYLLQVVGRISSSLSAGGVAVGSGSGIGGAARAIASGTGANTFGAAMGKEMGKGAGKHVNALTRQARRNVSRALMPKNKIKAG